MGLLGSLLLQPPAAAEPTTHVYRAQHRTAAELLPLVETALAGEGSATIDPATDSLVLAGEPRAIAVALQLLALQDRASRRVVLRAWSQRRSDLVAAGYGFDWSAGEGALRLGRLRSGSAPADTGTDTEAGVLGLADRRAQAVPAPEHSEFAATLRLLEGEVGEIASGRVVPFATRGEGGATTAAIEAHSGLLARARVLGDGFVQLDLTPFDGSMEDRGTTRLASASTRAVLAVGEALVVAGVERQTPSTASGQGAGSGRSRRDPALLLLRVEIE